MSTIRALRLTVAACAVAFTAETARAQCAQWSTGFARPSTPLGSQGIDATGDLDSLEPGGSAGIAALDVGTGPMLYALRQKFVAATTSELVRWTGARWESMAIVPANLRLQYIRGPWSVAHAGVPGLMLGSNFGHLWHFDGTTLTTLPSAGLGAFLGYAGTFDLGSGPVMYIAGTVQLFPTRGFVSSWNGSAWVRLGGDLPNPVYSLTVFDDGVHGPRLYAAGASVIAGTSGVAWWDGTAWQPTSAPLTCSWIHTFQGRLFAAGNGLREYVGGAWVDRSPLPGAGYYRLDTIDFGAGERMFVIVSGALAYLYDGTTFTQIPGAPVGGPFFANVPDANGPRMYMSGDFMSAGGFGCLGLASTDGATWSTLGRGFDTEVVALTRHGASGGDELFAAGWFGLAGHMPQTPFLGGSARWRQGEWNALGQGPQNSLWRFRTLRSIDLGAGPEVFGGGQWIQNQAALAVARFNGTSWTALPTVGGNVYALGSFDDGTGRELVVGGQMPGSAQGDNVSRFDGASWHPLGAGTNGIVLALEDFDEGAGERLFAGGGFTTADGAPTGGIARWDGTAWSALGSGITGTVRALCVHDDGTGPQLYAGLSVNQHDCVAHFDGASWTTLPSAIFTSHVQSITSCDFGAGPRLVITGATTSDRVEMWDGNAWTNLSGTAIGVGAACTADFGSGVRLYVAGDFTTIGGVACANVASYDGTSFAPLGSGIGATAEAFVSRLVRVQSPSGTRLHVFGNLESAGGLRASSAAAWDGATWSVFGNGFAPGVNALARFADAGGDALYAVGRSNKLSRWDGTTWSSVAQTNASLNPTMYALASADLGGGAQLYVTGRFTDTAYRGIAAWNGTTLSPLGAGLNDVGLALVAHDDGNGPRLFVGGSFRLATSGPGNRIAAWDGTTWSSLGGGAPAGSVNALARWIDRFERQYRVERQRLSARPFGDYCISRPHHAPGDDDAHDACLAHQPAGTIARQDCFQPRELDTTCLPRAALSGFKVVDWHVDDVQLAPRTVMVARRAVAESLQIGILFATRTRLVAHAGRHAVLGYPAGHWTTMRH